MLKQTKHVNWGGYVQAEIVARLIRAHEQSQKYVSGSELARELDVTRSAVWKHIEAIRQDGVKIAAVSRLGYRLSEPDDVLHAGAVDPSTALIGTTYHYLKEIDSTNLEGRRRAKEGCPNGLVILADKQIQGRARMGRQWFSPAGTGIYFSTVLFPENLPTARAALLVPLTAVAVHSALADMGVQADLKWPNDLLYDGRKLGGILLEISGEADQVRSAVLGVGINVNLMGQDLPEELRDVVISLMEIKNQRMGRRQLLHSMLASLDTFYADFQAGSRDFIEEYRRLCWTLGRSIRFEQEGKIYEGTAETIEDDGGLSVRLKCGKMMTIRSGDVHCL